jgi:hypothetical protein
MLKSALLILVVISLISVNAYAQQFEFENNFLQNLSFITGTDRGIEQNLDDNFGWMTQQGYTHLRFFGIYPNHYHTFPSATLDANGYPSNHNLEAVLEILVEKADQHGIVVNFDGWEVIAEANRDTLGHGVGYITEDELSDVIIDVLSLGVDQITEEQFGRSYLEAIQATTSMMGATHETTAGIWWTIDGIADEQLASVFSFFPHDQHECDSIIALGSTIPANVGNIHVYAEGSHYYGFPFSLAVGSFGTMESENWKNVFLFAQVQHNPERFSVEEQNTNFTIWDDDFNFMEHVGNEIIELESRTFPERPVVNLVIDAGTIYGVMPAVNVFGVDLPAIVNTFTVLGFRVIATVNTCLPDAEAYYVLLAGGANDSQVAPLPDFVLPLLDDDRPVFFQPAFGIPDENDSHSWTPLREHFGLPSGDTETLARRIPVSVYYNDFRTLWGGVELYATPLLERLLSSSIDTSHASVALGADIDGDDVALIIRNQSHFLVNSNVLHLEASYIFSDLLDGPLGAPVSADIAVVDDQAIIFAEYDTEVNLGLPWDGLTEVVRYDPIGEIVYNGQEDLSGTYEASMLRGELILLGSVSTPISGYENQNEINSKPRLLQNSPNPFNSSTKIVFEISSPGRVTLKVYNLLGQLEEVLIDDVFPAGMHSVDWQPDRLPSGVYFTKLAIGGNEVSRKLMLLK